MTGHSQIACTRSSQDKQQERVSVHVQLARIATNKGQAVRVAFSEDQDARVAFSEGQAVRVANSESCN